MDPEVDEKASTSSSPFALAGWIANAREDDRKVSGSKSAIDTCVFP
jgi:hypothetical protein